jgi:hypothetical protein
MLTIRCQTCKEPVHVDRNAPHAVCGNCGGMNSPEFHPAWSPPKGSETGPFAEIPCQIDEREVTGAPTAQTIKLPAKTLTLMVAAAVALVVVGVAVFLFYVGSENMPEDQTTAAPEGQTAATPASAPSEKKPVDSEFYIQIAVFAAFILFSIFNRFFRKKVPEEEDD